MKRALKIFKIVLVKCNCNKFPRMSKFCFRNFLNVFKSNNLKTPAQNINLSSDDASSRNTDLLITMTRKEEFTSEHILHFQNLIEDEIIQEFLEFDRCFIFADKYLLAMVFIYFVRAELPFSEYTRKLFFVALYLAHDIEEDDEELKYTLIEWGIDLKHRRDFDNFIQLRDELWKAMEYRACVSRKSCHEVMQYMEGLSLWKRERSPVHSGAVRIYQPQEKCKHCDLSDSSSKHIYDDDIPDISALDLDSSHAGLDSFLPSAKRMKFNEE